MKHVTIFTAAVLLTVASVRADAISVSNTGPIAFNATVDTTDTNYDVVWLTIASISGNPSSADKVTGLGGQWTVTGNAAVNGFYLPGSSTSWKGKTTSTVQDFETPDVASSAFNFDSTTGKMFDGSTVLFREPTSLTDVYSTFGNTWYSSDNSLYLPVGSLFGALYVTKGWSEIKFQDYNLSNPAKMGTVDLANQFETLTISVPEPGTLALLVCGLAGLLAYAWRKRK